MSRDEEVIYIGDDFEEQAEFGRQNRTGRIKRDLSAWRALSAGKTLGKAGLVDFVNLGPAVVTAPSDILEIHGDDTDALQLSVVFRPPQIPGGTATARQGFVDNVQKLAQGGYQANFCNVLGVVEWGMGGVSCRADFDVHNGACLNITASSFVRCRSFIETPASRTVISLTYEIGAYIGPGYEKGLGVQRTVNAQVADAAESGVFAVPRFARRVSVVAGTTGGAPPSPVFVGTIRFWNDSAAGNIVAEYTFAGNAPNMMTIPIPNGAYFFTLTNGTGGGVDADMSAIFDLAI